MTKFITSFSMFNFYLSEVNFEEDQRGSIDPRIPPTIENLKILRDILGCSNSIKCS